MFQSIEAQGGVGAVVSRLVFIEFRCCFGMLPLFLLLFFEGFMVCFEAWPCCFASASRFLCKSARENCKGYPTCQHFHQQIQREKATNTVDWGTSNTNNILGHPKPKNCYGISGFVQI